MDATTAVRRRQSDAGMAARTFSLAHLTLLDVPPPELVRIAASSGYDYVGLRTIPLHLSGEAVYERHGTY